MNLLTLFFQYTYNIVLKERYIDDSSTHPNLDPDLWLEIVLFGGPYRNRVYGLSNTTSEFLQTTHNFSTTGFSQSILSTQTLGSRRF
jgi:alpha-D-ribose 1-methylphosphonate 5-phosphate C-P lyase